MLESMRASQVALLNWGHMQRLQTRYAKVFNKVHGFAGHVFQGRYGARLIHHESYAREIVRYVELNPCAAVPVMTNEGQTKLFGWFLSIKA